MGDYFIAGELPVRNSQGEIMAKVTVTIGIVATRPNGPPQYTGPAVLNDLVVGVGRQLQYMDPDGDNVTVSVPPEFAAKVAVQNGILTPLVELGTVDPESPQGPKRPEPIVIELDDGKA
jgi:hypothetical protein